MKLIADYVSVKFKKNLTKLKTGWGHVFCASWAFACGGGGYRHGRVYPGHHLHQRQIHQEVR